MMLGCQPKELETAIATYTLKQNDPGRVTVKETADWGAEHDHTHRPSCKVSACSLKHVTRATLDKCQRVPPWNWHLRTHRLVSGNDIYLKTEFDLPGFFGPIVTGEWRSLRGHVSEEPRNPGTSELRNLVARRTPELSEPRNSAPRNQNPSGDKLLRNSLIAVLRVRKEVTMPVRLSSSVSNQRPSRPVVVSLRSSCRS